MNTEIEKIFFCVPNMHKREKDEKAHWGGGFRRLHERDKSTKMRTER